MPSTDPDDTLAEVRDAAAHGLRGVLLTQKPTEGAWSDEHWEPLWDELVALGLPVHFHVGGSGGLQHAAATGQGGPAGYLNSMMARKLEMSLALGTLVLSGVLARHPELKVVSVEGQIGWVPFWKEYIDHVYEKHRWHLDHHFDEPPSFYIDRQVYYTFMEDRHGVDARHACGVDRIMWANDYPHSETTWPHSHKILSEAFVGRVARRGPAHRARQLRGALPPPLSARLPNAPGQIDAPSSIGKVEVERIIGVNWSSTPGGMR